MHNYGYVGMTNTGRFIVEDAVWPCRVVPGNQIHVKGYDHSVSIEGTDNGPGEAKHDFSVCLSIGDALAFSDRVREAAIAANPMVPDED